MNKILIRNIQVVYCLLKKERYTARCADEE